MLDLQPSFVDEEEKNNSVSKIQVKREDSTGRPCILNVVYRRRESGYPQWVPSGRTLRKVQKKNKFKLFKLAS